MTTMSASALIVMAIIMVAAMATWLSLVYLAARAPRQHGTPEPPRDDGEEVMFTSITSTCRGGDSGQATKMQNGCPAGSAKV
jgi:hypothetical protein